MNEPTVARSKQADVGNAEKSLEANKKKDTASKPSSRGHKRQQASLGLGIITTNFDLSQSTTKGDDQTEEEEDRSKTNAFFSNTLPTPRPPPSLSRRAGVPPIQTSPSPNLPSSAAADEGADEIVGTPRLSFASRLRNLVAANKGTTIAPAPSAIPNNYMHRNEADAAHKLTAPATNLSYSDDEIMPLPSPAPALSSPSNSTTSTKPSFPKHRIVSPPQLSPVTPDKEAPSPVASTNIPVIALSPSFSPEKKNKIPSLSEEPMLGDMEDVTYGKSSAGGLVVPMMREYKFPSPTPQQYSDEDIIGKQIGDYRIKKLLGVGAFSKVYLAQRTNHDNAQYAIKMVNKQRISKDPRVRSSIEREVGVLKFIDHPSIVRLDATMETEQHLCIVMEYAKGQELFDFVQQMHRKIRSDTDATLDELLIKRIFVQLVRVVKWMHDHNVVHRDLKLENIIVHMENDGTPQVKVMDFGLARVVDPEAPILTTRCGSEEYAAPEIVQGLGYDGRQTDTWALGVILYSLLAGYLPFMYNPARGEKVSHLFYRIVSADYKWPSDWQQHPKHAASAEAKQVIERILVRQPEKRISLNEIESLPWFVS